MRHIIRTSWALASISAAAGCIEFKDDDSASRKDSATATAQAVDTASISVPSYEAFSLDTAGVGARFGSTPADDSVYGQISEKSAEARVTRFPMRVPKRGTAALQVQVLLDRAHFSPGIIDGVWGDNAAKALAFFRASNSGDTTAAADSIAIIDQATWSRLTGSSAEPILTKYTVTAADVKGPFTQVPDNVYEQAKLECLCYSSAGEGVAEKFHTSQKLLAQLNPNVSLANLAAGTVLVVPNVEAAVADSAAPSTGGVARIIVSRSGFWTHAVDSSGKVLAHFPSTLGGGYDPSPTGDFRVTNIAWNPTFHYQPTLFAEVSDKKPTARLPKGPNSPVGVVWMALSKPHYGMHGTSAPETIGYSNSHGCVRLTNWDAIALGRMVSKGTPVEFR